MKLIFPMLALSLIVSSCQTISGKNEQDMLISPCANPSAERQVYEQISYKENQNLFLDCVSAGALPGSDRDSKSLLASN